MPGKISDDVLALFAAVGRHDEIAAKIEARFGGASDAVFASTAYEIPSTLPPDTIAAIQRIPRVFETFQT